MTWRYEIRELPPRCRKWRKSRIQHDSASERDTSLSMTIAAGGLPEGTRLKAVRFGYGRIEEGPTYTVRVSAHLTRRVNDHGWRRST